jgi:hypothetical protein
LRDEKLEKLKKIIFLPPPPPPPPGFVLFTPLFFLFLIFLKIGQKPLQSVEKSKSEENIPENPTWKAVIFYNSSEFLWNIFLFSCFNVNDNTSYNDLF